ncbi:MAG TPA: Uma2 family endonuclease [Bryobacteraceae bacterium]
MAASAAVSVEDYIHTMYRPDCDYVDGEVIERNVGELSHSLVQGILVGIFRDLAKVQPIRVAPELRNRVSATRYRVPDICVMLKSQKPEPVLNSPPFLCIEILSPEDRMTRVLERVQEYFVFGVPYVWVIDPETRTAYSYTADEGHQVRDRLATSNPELAISLTEVFAELDEALRSNP